MEVDAGMPTRAEVLDAALVAACKDNQAAVADLLLARGADVHIDGGSPLLWACHHGVAGLQLLSVLLARGANPSTTLGGCALRTATPATPSALSAQGAAALPAAALPLPDASHMAKKDHSECVDSMVEFLNHGSLQFGPSMYVPLEHFLATYIAYCTRMSLKLVKTSGAKVAQPLADVDCRITPLLSLVYPRLASGAGASASRRLKTARFVLGCDVTALDNECML